MSMFDREAKVEILPVSGTLRVTIQPQPNVLLLLLEAAGIILFWGVTLGRWSSLSLLSRTFYVWGDIGAVLAWFYQLSGSEEIEFGPEKLTVRKHTGGWGRTREYVTKDCSELEWRPRSGKSHGHALGCKMGWRKIYFAEYITEHQAFEILSALQQYVPDVARTMGTMPGSSKSHFTTLGLNG